jgi:hypothetical protein
MVEKDEVFSAIRIVQVFNVATIPEIPLDKQGPSMVLFITGQLRAGDNGDHVVEISLARPDGQTKSIGEPTKTRAASSVPEFPPGFAIGIQVGVAPTQMGVHYFSIKFDGEEVRRVPFILRQHQQSEQQTQPK